MKLTYRHTLYACYGGYISSAVICNLMSLLFVTFNTKYGISLEKLGLLISINFCTQIVVDFLGAKYIDRIGYRIGVVAAHVFVTLGLICTGILPQVMDNVYAGLVIASVLNAIGSGLIEVLISPIVESLPGDEKASAMSMLHSFYCWGFVATVVLSTLYFVVAGIENWFWLPLLWAIIPFLNIFFFSKVPLRVLVEESERVPMSKLFANKVFWLMFILMVCAGAAEQAMGQWASLFAESGLGVSKTMGDLLGPCFFAVMMGVARMLYGIFGSKLNIRYALLGSAALCIVSYLMAITTPWPIVSLLGCGLTGFSVGLMWPGTLSLSSETYPQGGTAMFAILALGGDVGCASGPAVIGAVSGAIVKMGDAVKGWFYNAGATEVGLKLGLALALVFPIVMLIGVYGVIRKGKKA